MEVGNHPPSATRLPPHNIAEIRVCSERHCNAILGRHCKGNLCEQCVLNLRSRRPSSHSWREGVPAYNIPVSTGGQTTYAGIEMGQARLKKRRPSSVAGPYWATDDAFGPHNSQFTNSVNTYMNTVAPRMPPSLIPETPVISHFNSQGEVIQDVYQQIHQVGFILHARVRITYLIREGHSTPAAAYKHSDRAKPLLTLFALNSVASRRGPLPILPDGTS
ncbi:hypothetical protein CVT26_012652 [Gymnopilus dilepis]|uniref:Uncharacterized protein n=1 Tax=Gymnopilus dilepis TaxID=231916 RepID=A0A409YW54_9AGAR|nr:hypothetical protein CVT26_012652 [Gymnopilus dilepis]